MCTQFCHSYHIPWCDQYSDCLACPTDLNKRETPNTQINITEGEHQGLYSTVQYSKHAQLQHWKRKDLQSSLTRRKKIINISVTHFHSLLQNLIPDSRWKSMIHFAVGAFYNQSVLLLYDLLCKWTSPRQLSWQHNTSILILGKRTVDRWTCDYKTSILQVKYMQVWNN